MLTQTSLSDFNDFFRDDDKTVVDEATREPRKIEIHEPHDQKENPVINIYEPHDQLPEGTETKREPQDHLKKTENYNQIELLTFRMMNIHAMTHPYFFNLEVAKAEHVYCPRPVAELFSFRVSETTWMLRSNTTPTGQTRLEIGNYTRIGPTNEMNSRVSISTYPKHVVASFSKPYAESPYSIFYKSQWNLYTGKTASKRAYSLVTQHLNFPQLECNAELKDTDRKKLAAIATELKKPNQSVLKVHSLFSMHYEKTAPRYKQRGRYVVIPLPDKYSEAYKALLAIVLENTLNVDKFQKSLLIVPILNNLLNMVITYLDPALPMLDHPSTPKSQAKC